MALCKKQKTNWGENKFDCLFKMLKILSGKQIQELDQFTIVNEPITPIDLMERACHAFTNWLVQHFKSDTNAGIDCVPGNNGVDCLGIARLLQEYSYFV